MHGRREDKIFCVTSYLDTMELHEPHVTSLLFLRTQYINIYIYIGCLSIYGIHLTANNSPNNNDVFLLVSDLKTVYNNNY